MERGVDVSWAGRCCQLGGALLSVERGGRFAHMPCAHICMAALAELSMPTVIRNVLEPLVRKDLIDSMSKVALMVEVAFIAMWNPRSFTTITTCGDAAANASTPGTHHQGEHS
jgi:hypothetical protein